MCAFVVALAFTSLTALLQPLEDWLQWAALTPNYREQIERYQRGRDEEAVKALLQLDARSMSRNVESLLKEGPRPFSALAKSRSRAAAMLHTDAAEMLLENRRMADALSHLAIGRLWADTSEEPGEGAGSFRRRW